MLTQVGVDADQQARGLWGATQAAACCVLCGIHGVCGALRRQTCIAGEYTLHVAAECGCCQITST
jgi:hypothetical protein